MSTNPAEIMAYKYLAASRQYVFEDFVLEKSMDFPVVTVQAVVPANTDTKHYWKLTRDFFFFLALLTILKKFLKVIFTI